MGLTEEVRGLETLRCPTCLTLLLDSGEKRCPACHARLKTRSKPIVLGERTRITAQPLLPRERELQARVAAENAERERQLRRTEKAKQPGALTPSNASFEPAPVPAETTSRDTEHPRRPGRRAVRFGRRSNNAPPVTTETELRFEPPVFVPPVNGEPTNGNGTNGNGTNGNGDGQP